MFCERSSVKTKNQYFLTRIHTFEKILFRPHAGPSWSISMLRVIYDLEEKADAAKVVKIFQKYMKAEGHAITRDVYDKNIEGLSASVRHASSADESSPTASAPFFFSAQKDLQASPIFLK